MSTRYQQPTRFTGQYVGGYWAGYRFKEALGYTTGRHPGVDYNEGAGDDDLGNKAVAIADGVVVYRGDLTSKAYGLTVGIRHTLTAKQRKESGGKKYAYSRYMHLDSIDSKLKVGSKVNVGQYIGRVGKTGTAWAHLHLELWTDKNGLGWHLEYHKDTLLDSYLDPYKWIQAHLKEEVVPKPTPAPAPAPEPKLEPKPEPEPEPEPAPEPEPIPEPTPKPTPPEIQPPDAEPKPPSPAPPRPPVRVGFWQIIIQFLKGLFKWKD